MSKDYSDSRLNSIVAFLTKYNPPAGLTDVAQRRADLQLANKSRKSILFLPILPLLLTLVAPHDRVGHLVITVCWVLMVLTTAARLILTSGFRRYYDSRRTLWRTLFYGTALINATSWGLVTHIEFTVHGYSIVTQFCLLVMSAMIIVYNGMLGHTFKLSLLCNLALTLPVAYFWSQNVENMTVLAVSFVAYILFLIYNGIERKKEVWTRIVTELQLEQQIREIERVNRELQQTSAEAVQAASSKTRFIANTSHELRTPLHGILGNAELLLEMDLGERIHEYTHAIYRSGTSLLHLVDDILDLARVESGQLRLDMSPFSTHELLEELNDTLKRLAIIKNLDFEAGMDPNVPEWIISDRERLRQVLINLGGNAVKFTESGFVRVWMKFHEELDGDLLEVFVSDSGPGIPENKQKAIFDDFVQIDSSSTRHHAGSGLGLSICKSLIDTMHGKIGIESLVGIGTTFWVGVPVERAQSPESLVQISPVSESITTVPVKRRILIVDDNQVNRDLLASQLKILDHNPVTASGGAEAIALTQGMDFDLIFMDCQMPGMDGYEATRRLRDLEPPGSNHIPIVAITANAMPEERNRCLQSGMDDYLSKPLNLKILRELLAKLLSKCEQPEHGQEMDMDEEQTDTSPSSDKPSFDQDRIGELRKLSQSMGKELLISVLKSFDDESNEKLIALKSSWEEQDMAQVIQAAHALKGMCLDIGMSQLALLFGNIESEPTTMSSINLKKLTNTVSKDRASLARAIGVNI